MLQAFRIAETHSASFRPITQKAPGILIFLKAVKQKGNCSQLIKIKGFVCQLLLICLIAVLSPSFFKFKFCNIILNFGLEKFKKIKKKPTYLPSFLVHWQ